MKLITVNGRVYELHKASEGLFERPFIIDAETKRKPSAQLGKERGVVRLFNIENNKKYFTDEEMVKYPTHQIIEKLIKKLEEEK